MRQRLADQIVQGIDFNGFTHFADFIFFRPNMAAGKGVERLKDLVVGGSCVVTPGARGGGGGGRDGKYWNKNSS